MLEDPIHRRAEPISHENLHASLPVECVIFLTEVKEEFIEDLLSDFYHLPKQLGFEGVGPCSLTRPEATKDIVGLYCRPYLLSYHSQQCIPQDIHNPDPSEIPTPLRDYKLHLPHTLRW